MRKQAHEGWHDADELCIALGKVARAIQLLEKEARRGTIAGCREQVCISARESLLLIGLQRVDARRQIGRAVATCPLHGDAMQLPKNRTGAGGHRCHLCWKCVTVGGELGFPSARVSRSTL